MQLLGRTLWRDEILPYHKTGPSNGSIEGLNLCVRKGSVAVMLGTFEHHRPHGLLPAGCVSWPVRPSSATHQNPEFPKSYA